MSKLKKEDEILIDKKDEIKINNTWSTDESFVKNEVLKDFNFCKIYKGWIPSAFKEVESKKFSFVHIDVVLYEPTLETIEFFFPKLVKGGVMCCGSYNSSAFRGAKNAWDKYFKDKKYTFFFQNPVRGCFLIK
jgi:O-methyltransferase